MGSLLFATLQISSNSTPGLCPTKVVRPKAICNHIARMEGFYVKGSLPQRLNNPASLVFAHQRGASRDHSGFARFATVELGWSALERDVKLKLVRKIPLHRGWEYLK